MSDPFLLRDYDAFATELKKKTDIHLLYHNKPNLIKLLTF